MYMASLLQQQHLVSLSYFSLYLSWMAGSYEIITFLCVPRSCVRQASRLPNTGSLHSQNAHSVWVSYTHFSLRFWACVCLSWQLMEMQSKLWSVGEWGGNHRAVCWGDVCVFLRWGDISGLTWSGAVPPRAWRALPGKDTDGGLGSPGGNFMVWTKSFALWLKRPVKHKLQSAEPAQCFFWTLQKRKVHFYARLSFHYSL